MVSHCSLTLLWVDPLTFSFKERIDLLLACRGGCDELRARVWVDEVIQRWLGAGHMSRLCDYAFELRNFVVTVQDTLGVTSIIRLDGC